MLKLTRVYFEGVHLAASLVAGLKAYHPGMVGFIVDAVLEVSRRLIHSNHVDARACCFATLSF